MAQENVGININVQGNAVESIGNVKKALKEANAELINAQANFGDYSKQAIEAAKKVAGLRDQISEARETADLFDPGKKFQALAGVANAAAGGFTAVQGALGLLGVESESVEKTLLKVQSALALSQGLSTITDAAKDFKRFGTIATGAFNSIKTGAAAAFKSIKAGLASTGIGLLVIALGSIVAYWDDIKELVGGVSSEQEELNKATQENLEAQEEKLDAIDGQSNQLRLQGKSEKDILNLKIAQTNEAIRIAELGVANAKATKEMQIQASRRNREILTGVLDFISKPIRFILGAVDSIGKSLGKDFGLAKTQEDILKANKIAANYVFDPAETAKEGDKAIAEAEKVLSKFNEKKATSIIALRNLDKQAAAAAKSEADKRAEEESARIEKQLADEKKLTEDLLAEYEKRRNAANNAKTLSQKELNALDQQERAQQEEENNKRFDAQISFLGKTKNFTLDGIQQIQQANAESKEAEARIDKIAAEQKIALAQQTASALTAVSDILGKETAAGKTLAISAALINTYLGITQALKLPFPASIPAAAIAAATGFGAVKNIIATKVPGSTGGGGANMTVPNVSAAAPITPPQPQAATTNLSNQTINAIGNQAIRSYVVESDVTSNQQRIAAIQQRARFG
jgi:hypothetical protein